MRRLALLALLISAGCSAITGHGVDRAVAPAPHETWKPPAPAQMPPAPGTSETPPAIPEEYLRPGATLSLATLVDLALKNNPATREAWSFARAAAAEVGSTRSLYFPQVELGGVIQRQKQAAVGGQFTFLRTTYGPSVAVSWLLFDFGGREADVQEATRALYAADWTHNQAIQDVVLGVAQAYYEYLNAKAIRIASESNRKEAGENLAAAEERHRAGVATIADVLQARTQVSQADLALQEAEGNIQILRGSLATALGVPATIPVDVGDLPGELPLEMVEAGIEDLIARAVAARPDLAAERFRALAAESRIRSVRAEGLPRIAIAGSGDRTWFHTRDLPDPLATNWTGAITLRFPIFTGFDVEYRTRQAREEAEAAKARAERLEDQVILETWSSYFAVQTATRRVRTSRDLLQSATQSAEVANGRYRAGVGSILDLLTAQAALANARAEEVQSRSVWFLAMAQLAHATGSLEPGGPAILRANEAGTGGGAR